MNIVLIIILIAIVVLAAVSGAKHFKGQGGCCGGGGELRPEHKKARRPRNGRKDNFDRRNELRKLPESR